MKPLNLKISGLQSFREEQEIPFDRLSERGVFGIFGPTGSGKSTILDAVTLALFGKVVRAKNKTQGILNTAEKKLSISFLFELNAPGGKKNYRVDRRYSKKDEISVKHNHSRLVEIDKAGLDAVLAEGESRVTGQVETLLGMKAEDFTRAVLLPQGKFAEFLLNLEGVKRKEMLQRLFSLERYGKLLTERLNKKVDRTRLELTGVESELAGIGNASRATLDEVEKRVKNARALEESAAGVFKEARSGFEKAQKIWGLQEELKLVEEDQIRHAARAEEVGKVEIAVDTAERAGKAVPLIRARDAASDEKERSSLAKEKAEAAAAACRVKARAQKGLFDQARECREKEGPELIALKTGLEVARRMEEEIIENAAEVKKYQNDRRLRYRERDGSKEKAEKYERRRSDLLGETRREEEKLTHNTVTGTRREQVAKAKREADSFTVAAKTLEAAEREVKNRQAELTAAGVERLKAEKDLAGLEEQVRVLRTREEQAVQPAEDEELAQKELYLINRKKDIGRLAELEATIRKGGNSVDRLYKELNFLESALEEAKDAVQKNNGVLFSLNKKYTETYLQNHRMLAARLVENLVPGAPCPVCGSTEHPCPAPADIKYDVAEGALEEIRGQIERAEKALEEAQRKANAAAAAFSGKKAELEITEQEVKRVGGEILTLGRGLLGEDFKQEALKKTVTLLVADAGKEESELRQEREKLKVWREDRQKAQRLLNRLVEDLSHKKSAGAVAVQKIRAAEKELASSREILEEAGAGWEKAEAALKQALNELGVETADNVKAAVEAAAEVKRMDEAAEAARARLAQLRQELERCAASIEAARREESVANAAISGLDSRIAEKEELLAAKKREVNRLTGGRPAAGYLAETTRKLVDLQTAEKSAKEAYERSEVERAKAEEDLARKTAVFLEAVKQWEKCREDLDGMLRKQHFVTAKEAEDAYLSEEEIAEKKSVLEAHKDEGKKLAGNRERITGHLGDKRITSEQWMEAQKKLDQAREAKEEATRRFIELDKEFRDLGQKHTRWEELEKRREILDRETSLLETLKKLLKGDRFVQFLAHEQLEFVVRHATERLKGMTNERYALLLDSESNFLIRDDANGSVKRPVTSLSGGETFQASLAMALALSTQIQLRGQHPLEFFFLDEGFGSLDQNSLEVMVSTLERLHMERMTIGVISHVGELQQRIGRKLLVEPSESNGKGSRVKLDFA